MDEPLYFIKGDPRLPSTYFNYAVEMHFLSSGQTDMTKQELDAITQGMVMMPLKAFDDFNKEISQLCSEVSCDYKLQAALANLVAKLHAQAVEGN